MTQSKFIKHLIKKHDVKFLRMLSTSPCADVVHLKKFDITSLEWYTGVCIAIAMKSQGIN